jgi:hypothetical protein
MPELYLFGYRLVVHSRMFSALYCSKVSLLMYFYLFKILFIQKKKRKRKEKYSMLGAESILIFCAFFGMQLQFGSCCVEILRKTTLL